MASTFTSEWEWLAIPVIQEAEWKNLPFTSPTCYFPIWSPYLYHEPLITVLAAGNIPTL